jgi:aryl sulfotransferase
VTGAHTVWLASYPKSGNTWVRAMLAALTAEADDPDLDINGLGGGPIASSRPHIEQWLGFASSDLTFEEIEALRPACDAAFDRSLDEVRFRKIHDALWTRAGSPIVPPERTRGAIYVVRDPRDVAVSFAHHSDKTNEWSVEALGDPARAMVETGHDLDPQVPQLLGTWSDHVSGWTGHDLFPVLTVRYEDMAADPLAELARLASFAGLEPNAERLAAAVGAASFETLRAKEARDGFFERPGLDRPFFRSGRVGGWRDELAPELAARLERQHGDVMRRLGYPTPRTSLSDSSP